MFRKILSAGFLCATSFCFAADIPTMVDFEKLQATCANTDPSLYVTGAFGFNQAPELASIVACLKRNYGLQEAVETGTFQGNTTVLLSYLFDKVYTIEIDKSYYKESERNLAQFKNVGMFEGNSVQVLPQVLAKAKGKGLFFYLDAHWQDYWPLLGELEAIAKTHANNCVIMIDDVQVPGRADIPFDSYKGQALNYEYVKPKLDQIFTKHTVHYIVPHNIYHRAKMLIVPQK